LSGCSNVSVVEQKPDLAEVASHDLGAPHDLATPRDLHPPAPNGCATIAECPSVLHAMTTCSAGQCGFSSCLDNYADCNSAAADGCEVALLTDSRNCGGCGRVCRPGSICNAGWCVENSGTTQQLRAVWGSSASDLYAVGWQGTILHSTGDGAWVAQASGTANDLQTVGGSSASDVYATGGNCTLLHSTGNGVWSALPHPNGCGALLAIWVAPNGEVYLVGNDTILHGGAAGGFSSSYTISNSSVVYNLSAVWGSAPNDVYGVGSEGTILHTAGGDVWTLQANQAGAPGLNAVWGSGAGDVYAVGDNNTILHSAGAGVWTHETGPTSGADWGAVWGASASEIYLAGPSLARSSGSGGWTVDGIAGRLSIDNAIWGAGGGNVWLVGVSGGIIRLP
jgi:hypothetical protein